VNQDSLFICGKQSITLAAMVDSYPSLGVANNPRAIQCIPLPLFGRCSGPTCDTELPHLGRRKRPLSTLLSSSFGCLIDWITDIEVIDAIEWDNTLTASIA